MTFSHWSYEREFELRFLKSHGTAFQDLFADLMEHAYPGDYIRVRPHGNKGDLKCDGYLASQKTVFQLYGPDDMHSLLRLLNKISIDYLGAREKWADKMDQWIFVHNSLSGIPAQAVQLIDSFRDAPDAPIIEVWGFERLRNILGQLSVNSLQNLLPQPSQIVHQIEINDSPDAKMVEHYWLWLQNMLSEPMLNSYLNTMRFLQLPITLVPQRLSLRTVVGEGENRKAQNERTSNRQATSPSKDLIIGPITLKRALRDYRHVLILGDSGSGKSTFIRRYAREIVEKLSKCGFKKRSGHTPIIIELWRFGSSRSLMDLILGSVKRSDAAIPDDQLFHVMRRGYVILFADGLDEVPIEFRRDCLAQINDLIEEYPRIPVVLTSRQIPEIPPYFYRLEIQPLGDEDITNALKMRFGGSSRFREIFNNYSPEEYVHLMLRPEVRQLCYTPLAIGIITTLLENNGALPDNLFDTFDRFISLLVNWEVQKGNISSLATTVEILEETAYTIIEREQNSLPMIGWVKKSGKIISKLRSANITASPTAENMLKTLLSTGILKEVNAEILFSHRSLLEFCAARRIASSNAPIHCDPVALHLEVARFLCSKSNEVDLLLDEFYLRCYDVYEILPLLEEANSSGKLSERYRALFSAIIQCDELSINLMYADSDDEWFSGVIDDVVNTCAAFKPKALLPLRRAAENLIMAPTQWYDIRSWFEKIVLALKSYNWPGAMLYYRFIKIGFFEHTEIFQDDGSDLGNAYNLDELYAYLDALEKDDFDQALRHLDRLAKILSDYIEKSGNGHTNIYHLPAETLSRQMKLWSDDDLTQSESA